MPDTIDLPALRAVIAGVRQRKARILGTLPDNFTTLMDVQAMSVMKDDLTTLASACERLAEENERMREDLRDAHRVLVMARAFHAYSGGPLSGPFPSVVERRLSGYRTSAPAGKAGDMSTGLTIDSSATAGK